jgi:hypothetical protein
MPDVFKYAKEQRQHRNAGTIISIFERIEENGS